MKRQPPTKWEIGRIAYLKGWDSAIIDPCGLPQCPYSRQDYAGRWKEGRADCLANKPLPRWAK